MKEIREKELTLDSGEIMEYGMCVWSTGVGPTALTTALPFAKTARGRIAVDECQRVLRQIRPESIAAQPESVDEVSKEQFAEGEICVWTAYVRPYCSLPLTLANVLSLPPPPNPRPAAPPTRAPRSPPQSPVETGPVVPCTLAGTMLGVPYPCTFPSDW